MSDEAIDLKEVLERVQDDKELLVELFDIFLEDYNIKRKALSEVIAKKDIEQLKAISHSLKGASGNISAKKLHVIFTEMEKLAKSSEVSRIEAMIPGLDNEYTALIANIQKLKQEFKK